jgi:sugar phosphate isomerase/epimerase
MRAHPRLSCSEYSFPSLAREERLGLVALLGFESVDVGLFLDPNTEVRHFLADPSAHAQVLRNQLEATRLKLADLFLIIGGDNFAAHAINAQDRERRLELRTIFEATTLVCRELEHSSLSILPGVTWPDDRRASWETVVFELRWRVEHAAPLGIEVRIEPHIGSIVSTPELVIELLRDVPGLGLTLDAGHFVFQAIGLDRILPLAPLARHVHLSGARAGAVHVALEHNEIDFGALVSALESAGFCGWYSVEYVPMSKWGANSTDVLGAVIELRNAMGSLLPA